MLDRHDIVYGAVLAAAGIGIVGIMAYPMISPRHAFEAARPPSVRAAFERRWLPPPLPDPPALAKADRLTMEPALTGAKRFGPVAGLVMPPLGEERIPPPAVASGPVEQAIERQHEDAAAEHAIREYHREAARRFHSEERQPRDVCARHGMHKRYFHTHHGRHLSWRCVGRGRRS